ncbi:unnamed protein product [Auanema sp. JU1783]|nr:unnamed protein product [Auanema sp. JU1783]
MPRMLTSAPTHHPIIQGYLVIYNLLMFLIHYFVFVDVLHEVKKNNYSYFHHFETLRIATALQLFDVFHGLIGLTKTNFVVGLFQVFGRLFVLQCIHGIDSLYKEVFPVLVLVTAYLLIELIRYPYYCLRAINQTWKPITFLRYNAWIVLYPIGFVCEYNTLARVGYTHYTRGTFAPYVPNCLANFYFFVFVGSVLTVLIIYLAQFLLSHMDKQRQKHYNKALIFPTVRRIQLKARQLWRKYSTKSY